MYVSYNIPHSRLEGGPRVNSARCLIRTHSLPSDTFTVSGKDFYHSDWSQGVNGQDVQLSREKQILHREPNGIFRYIRYLLSDVNKINLSDVNKN